MQSLFKNCKEKRRGINSRFFLLKATLPKFFTLLKFSSGIIFLFITSCSNRKPAPIKQNYFSIHNFFTEEAQQLTTLKVKLKKVNQLNSNHDSSIISTPDWEKELSLFTDADINKPAWKNSFKIDSVFQDSILMINYRTNEKNISIHQVEISCLNNKVQKIHIVKEAVNLVYSESQELWYVAQQGFRINGKQKVLGFFETNYSIAATFVKSK